MSHTRGKDQNEAGKFAYTCWDYDGNVFRAEGGFATAQEADHAAAMAERQITFGKQARIEIDDDIFDMSDEELLAMLAA